MVKVAVSLLIMVILYSSTYMVPELKQKIRREFALSFCFLKFYRWEFLLNQGKRVFVVGDLNIAPFAIDRCDADADFEKNIFRQWLRSLLRNCGGCFFDVFRSIHPERKGAYTCFSQRIGAEEFNYGSRIDHILVAGPCIHEDHGGEYSILDCHVEDCDILTEFKRGSSDALSKWNGGRSTKLEGSDHIPVYVKLTGIPDLLVHNTPALAIRYIPEVRGWQQSIVSFLSKSNSQQKEDSLILSSETSCEVPCSSQEIQSCSMTTEQHKKELSLTKRKSFCSIKDNKRVKGNSSSQLTIKSFFKRPPEEPSITRNQNISEEFNEFNSNDMICSKEKGNAAVLEWQRIQERMKTSLPLCKGHREPCVARSVKKGSNIGRLFYVCARAQGPASNPEANCNHFQWASFKSKDKNK